MFDLFSALSLNQSAFSAPMVVLLVIALAYAVGSLSFAVIVSTAMGLNDPRTYGSKNPGATNVLRSGNKVAAVLTLMLDGFKAWLPMVMVQHWGATYALGAGTLAMVGLAAFLGHLYPVFFKFKGGKGVATAIGVVLAVNPWLGLATVLTWLIVAYFSRYSSLAALVSAVFAPVYYLLCDGFIWRAEPSITLALAVMGALLIWRHAANISKLIQGTESTIGQKQ